MRDRRGTSGRVTPPSNTAFGASIGHLNKWYRYVALREIALSRAIKLKHVVHDQESEPRPSEWCTGYTSALRNVSASLLPTGYRPMTRTLFMEKSHGFDSTLDKINL